MSFSIVSNSVLISDLIIYSSVYIVVVEAIFKDKASTISLSTALGCYNYLKLTGVKRGLNIFFHFWCMYRDKVKN